MNHPEVSLYLLSEDNNIWLRALSIPLSDIIRLATRPLKWLRFVAFAICGAVGDLSLSPEFAPVDYDGITIETISQLAQSYYYHCEGGSALPFKFCEKFGIIFLTIYHFRSLSPHRYQRSEL